MKFTLGLVVVAVAVASAAAAAGDNCSFRCLDVYKPVCGSNGETYSNSCHLRLASCQSKNEIIEASDGECASTPATSTTGISDENGVQYSNQCYMEVAKCNDVGDEGINGYENPDLDPQRKLTFAPGYKDSLCHDMECPDNYTPVCGSDGVTYSNECNLSITNCNHPEQNVTIIGDGACSNKQQQQS